MNFTLPFSDETIKMMAGKTMILSENIWNEPLFKMFFNASVKGGGDVDRGHFEVVDGVLRLMDKQGLFCEFTGAESRNGSVFAVGKAMQSVSKNGLERVVMHEKKPLPNNGFGICISSNVNYAGTTLPVLLESIRKAKFDMKNVVAVVGGYTGEKTEMVEGAKVIYVEANSLGFNGLRGITGDFPYWLMLHDTCEAERSFLEATGDIDIGLAPDVIRLRLDMDDWTGFYRTGFLERVSSQTLARPESVGEIVKLSARVVTNVLGSITDMGKKDVYGKGNVRIVERLPAGIRKYRRFALGTNVP
jgi:hypothetical protein